MFDHETKVTLNDAAGVLLRLVEALQQDGDRTAALAASDAADHLLVLLDLDGLRARAQE